MRPGARIREAFAHHWQRTLAALVGLALALFVVSSSELHAAINAAFFAAQGAILDQGRAGMLLFVALSALSAMVAFFSSAVLVPIGVYAWGSGVTFLLLWAGWLAGGMLAYATGRTFGRPLIAWIVHADKLARYERRVSANAPFAVILLFQMALPSEVPGYVVGVLRYPFARYLSALALAELPFALGSVYLGESFIRGDYRGLVGFGLALIALSVAAVSAWHRANGRR